MKNCSLTPIFLLLAAGTALADKTDVVYLRNGDRVTCEIKNLERGRLKVSTDSMDTVYIEWNHILKVSSKEYYIIELQDGSRLEGSLTDTEGEKQLLLRQGEETRRVEMASVVWLDPLKLDDARVKRWDGSVSLGFDASKANSDTSLSFSFDARRRAEEFWLNFGGSVYSRSQDDSEDSLRANLGGVYRGLLEDRWYWAALGTFERNDELGIDLRSLAGAGYGRLLVQTGRSLWSMTGGLAVVNEQLAGDEAAETSLEALFNTEYEYFTYDTPKTSLAVSLSLFPSLTESGRIRGNVDFGLRRELVKDLFLEISLYESFDSEPPDEGEKTDYGIVTGLGYTF